MSNDLGEYNVPENWLEEYSRLVRGREIHAYKPDEVVKLNYSDACRFVLTIFHNKEMREIFLGFFGWLSEWKERPESEYTDFRDANDYPRELEKMVYMFTKWFFLRHNLRRSTIFSRDLAYQAYHIMKNNPKAEGDLNLDILKTLPFVVEDGIPE